MPPPFDYPPGPQHGFGGGRGRGRGGRGGGRVSLNCVLYKQAILISLYYIIA